MSTSTKRIYNLLWIGAFLLLFIFYPMVRYNRSAEDPKDRVFINLGLDLKGGVDLVLAVDKKQYKGEVTKEQMEGAIEVMRRKIDPGGVKEIVVQQVGNERIAVQVPGEKDPETVKEIIGRPDALKWVDTGTKYVEPRTLVTFVDDVSKLEEQKPEEAKEQSKPGEAPSETTAPETTAPEATTPGTPPAAAESQGAAGEPSPAEAPAETPSETPAAPANGAEETPADVTEGGKVQGTTSSEEDNSGYTEEFKAALAAEKAKEEGAENGETPAAGNEANTEGESAAGEGTKQDHITIITDPNSDKNQVVITGDDLEWVQTSFYSSQPVVSFRIKRDAAGKFAKHTGSHIGQFMAIVLNDEVVSCPRIRSRIGREGQIEGFKADEAKQLEMLLNAGRIPVPLTVVQERTVSPTLGEESIHLSLKAGIYGLLLVLLFMLLYYRLPGFLADIALLTYGVFFLGAMSMLNATLTLPGIAGVILSIGMAVDANVIIFERLKEELGAGKTVATAVRDAFKRAWTAILDGNVTTLITGFILWSIGSGPIKGFAVTLCLGIIISMVTALYVTRNLLEAVITTPTFQHRWLLGATKAVK